MPRPESPTVWTLEMVHALPDDGNRYELLDGELLVSPSPSRTHQRVARDLLVRLHQYLQTVGGFEALMAPFDVIFSDTRLFQPDLLVAPLPAEPQAERDADVGRVVLAVEVLSPSTARNDRVKKRRAYQEEGVPEYWVVDPDARHVERWRPGDTEPEVVTSVVRWQPSTASPSLEIDLAAVFSAARG